MMFKGYVLKEYWTKDCLFLRALSLLQHISNCNQNSVIVPSSFFFSFFSIYLSAIVRSNFRTDRAFCEYPRRSFPFFSREYFPFWPKIFPIPLPGIFSFFAENIFYSFPENFSLFYRERFLFFSREYFPFLAHHICFKIESCQLGWDLS